MENTLTRASFHPACADCGAEVELCANGCDRPPITTWKKTRICGGCQFDALWWAAGADSTKVAISKGADKLNDPKFRCGCCAMKCGY